MKRKVICFVVMLSIIMGALGLSACSQSLADYKGEAKATIQAYADSKGQSNYSEENWTAICEIVVTGKAAVDEAENKAGVDSAVNEAKEDIDIFMYGAENYSGGDGTTNNPYIISNRGQLINFSNQINNGENIDAYFVLVTDIDLDGMEWTPIGIISANYKGDLSFHGVFNGNGHEISNFRITTRLKNIMAQNIGLFGYSAGTIRNLGVVNFDIDILWYGRGLNINAGGFIGNNAGSISNCYAIGEINLQHISSSNPTMPTYVNTGGMVGINDENGAISNCYAVVEVSGDIEGSAYFGGLIGTTIGESTIDCLAIGNVNLNEYDSSTNVEKRIAGALFGKCAFPANLENSFWFEELLVCGREHRLQDLTCTALELDTSVFYIDKLGWNADDWNLEDIQFVDGKYIDGKHPKLKQI